MMNYFEPRNVEKANKALAYLIHSNLYTLLSCHIHFSEVCPLQGKPIPQLHSRLLVCPCLSSPAEAHAGPALCSCLREVEVLSLLLVFRTYGSLWLEFCSTTLTRIPIPRSQGHSLACSAGASQLTSPDTL